MIKPTKRVSILLSCFNGTELVESYIDFLLENDIANLCTLIAINFPNSHKNPDFVTQQLRRYPDLVLINHSNAVPLFDALNIGIKRANTEFVSTLNLEDRVSQEFYRMGVERLDSYEADVFSSDSTVTCLTGNQPEFLSSEKHLCKSAFDQEGIAHYGLAELVDFHNGLLITRNIPLRVPIWRKQLHEQLGYFDPGRFGSAADYEFWLRRAAAKKKFIVYERPETPICNDNEISIEEEHRTIHPGMKSRCVFSSRKYFNHLSKDLVSNVVVAHDKPELLLECLKSIQSQTYPLLECIVVLDNEDDGALQEYVRRHFEHDARFLAVSLTDKRERSYCRNVGIELATGSWVTIVDGDDLLPPDSLAVRLKTASTNKGDLACGGLEVISEGGEPIHTIPFANEYTIEDLRIGWPHHCSLLYPAEMIKATRYPAVVSDCTEDSSVISGEDVKFLMELLKNNPGSKFVNSGKTVYTYRRYFSSSFKNRCNSIRTVINIIISYYGDPDDGDPRYKNAVIERSVAYVLWLTYKLWNEKSGEKLFSVADAGILDIAAQASESQIRQQEQLFLSDLQKLNAFNDDDAPRLVSAATKVLGAIAHNRQESHKPANRLVKSAHKYDPIKIDYQRLCRWKNRHQGENCILVCNGTSLDQVNFKKIDPANFVFFGWPERFSGSEDLGYAPRYIAAVDPEHFGQSADSYQHSDTVKFIGKQFSPAILPQNPLTYFMNTDKPPVKPGIFSTEISEYVSGDSDITLVALQLIYYMGFSNVYIVGMDHGHSKPVNGEGLPGNSDLHPIEIARDSALKIFRDAGKQIFDCSVNGASSVFPKLDISAVYTRSADTPHHFQAGMESPTEIKDLALPGASTTQKICYFPAFSPADDINFSMVRAAWYLACIPGAEITVFADKIYQSLDCYDYYDPAINAVYTQLRTAGRLIEKPFVRPEDMVSRLHDSDIIICWKDNGFIEHLLGHDALKKLTIEGKIIYRVGASNNNESSIYIEISKDLAAFQSGLIANCQQKFERLLKRFAGRENAFLFATGPSSKAYHKFRYGGPNNVSIICNSVINDEEMMAAVQPDILVFADPIFHFGCSTYARAFRKKLLEVCDRYDFEIVIPIKYYPIFTFHLPELADRVIGIPHYKDRGININLCKDFYIHTERNVLTYLMIPVGASLAKNLYVIGCDGRPLEENDYFWGHNEKTQFSGEMAAIQKAHPSFFKIDYDEYYETHCRGLEDHARTLEDNGQSLRSMWGSFIPAFMQRVHVPDALKTDEVIISINPDLRSDFGHWLQYDRRLAETTESLIITLANQKLTVNPAEIITIPTFSNRSLVVKKNYSEAVKQRLENEFSEVVDQLTGSLDNATRLKFIMYSGDVTYIDAFDHVISQLGPRATLSVNLFQSHFDYDVSSGDFVCNRNLYVKVLSTEYRENRPWLKIFVDSERMQSILKESFAAEVGLWPMVDLDVNRHIISQIGPKLKRREKLVVFPGNGQMAKGFDLACDFISKYGERLSQKYQCRFAVRDVILETPENTAILEQKLEQLSLLPFVDILTGTLSEEEFLKLFYHADWIILPYRRRNFYSRTSSCVVNAILSGVSVLVTDDSWMSEQVARFGAGLAFADGDIDELYGAFCTLAEGSGPATDLEKAEVYYSTNNILPAIA